MIRGEGPASAGNSYLPEFFRHGRDFSRPCDVIVILKGADSLARSQMRMDANLMKAR
jgi:hypothetical protein